MEEPYFEALSPDRSRLAGGLAPSVRHVVCPYCESRFLVDREAFDTLEGRRLRCASCGHLWQYSPPPGALEASFLEEAARAKAAAPRTEPALPAVAAPDDGRREPRFEATPPDPVPDAAPLPPVAAEPRPAARSARVRTGILGLAVLAAGLALLAILGRDTVTRVLPSLSSRVAAVAAQPSGPAESPGAGLKVTVTPTRSADALIIRGDIVNAAAIARQVPRLRVTLLDSNKSDLVSRVVDPTVRELPPGAVAHFNTVFQHPIETATRVDVTFATD